MMLFVKSAYNNVVSFYQRSADQSLSAQVTSVSTPIRRFRAWHFLALVLTAFWLFFAIALFQIDPDFTVLAVGIVILAILTVFSLVIVILARAYQNNL